MRILGFTPAGFEGELVTIEVDIRRGIPGTEIVGLASGAVKEARERVRIAVRNSGFDYPADRIVVNLAPAGVPKAGASFDLPIAAGILRATGQLEVGLNVDTMILGELQLDGCVRPVAGVLSAVSGGAERGVNRFLVPTANVAEGRCVHGVQVVGLLRLSDLGAAFEALERGIETQARSVSAQPDDEADSPYDDFSELFGQAMVKRALQVAAAGMHHILLFGPPGSGKTMAIRRLQGILPPLGMAEALEVTRIYSLAGILPPDHGLMMRRPFRTPHHSASLEGIIGGGRSLRPGEISLAHRGILFLDEVPEFHPTILQSLREPLEDGIVSIARAERSYWFPAEFQLCVAANPCPCGNLGRERGVCLCSAQDLYRYWRRLGGALLDRVDMRVPVSPAAPETFFRNDGATSRLMRDRVLSAVRIQEGRFKGEKFCRNGRIPVGKVQRYCPLSEDARSTFEEVVSTMGLSSRATVSVLRIARTIADLGGSDGRIHSDEILEACQYRRYGDGDYFWGGENGLH
ncbi:MAG TPA: YifB family Mg chelatase-like AAA ATPase [Spirochaetia bacterium]|nr:YifB family Mg chelatase-like AAA ATPase [Spirochaetia bacterium]